MFVENRHMDHTTQKRSMRLKINKMNNKIIDNNITRYLSIPHNVSSGSSNLIRGQCL